MKIDLLYKFLIINFLVCSVAAVFAQQGASTSFEQVEVRQPEPGFSSKSNQPLQHQVLVGQDVEL